MTKANRGTYPKSSWSDAYELPEGWWMYLYKNASAASAASDAIIIKVMSQVRPSQKRFYEIEINVR